MSHQNSTDAPSHKHKHKHNHYESHPEKKDSRFDHFLRKVLHFVERVIAILALLGVLAALGVEVYTAVTKQGYFADMNHLLHILMTFVVGLEFVRMLIDTTPANILEVLTVAITRYVILSHEDPWSNVACIACIAGLFAIRRYLVRRNELKEEMVDME